MSLKPQTETIVKLGCNDHCNNDFMLVRNKDENIFWFQIASLNLKH